MLGARDVFMYYCSRKQNWASRVGIPKQVIRVCELKIQGCAITFSPSRAHVAG